ncbi:protein PHOTOPERIOD-INDEPENDENT EARLY FLOWERING 1 [Mercurialis annua]|uniref:protein PHOTOPERIOD-INDEPENDENT EARLY FLOWERING 1 n=1 Tax=Mercurialis annua TaxID=3986 RepID=UPI00215EF45C|nr:protein PHOTOPERIOD-INDEPENDENT EARLY FLOWERING 1 [Mercurialis annua]
MEFNSKEGMHRKRKKALEAPKEPRRPKTHWDHVLEEMVWLSKDFEAERKWKLAQAKKVALRASKGMLDQSTREERKSKEEEQRMRKVALNITKDVKKFWIKIEKLVLYKHQMELDEKKKKALDKQLEFLLGQTERYSTMLAENLVDKPLLQDCAHEEGHKVDTKEPEELVDAVPDPQSNTGDNDDDYDVQSEESEDDEHTIDEDEALITEQERQEELEALNNEMDVPLEELLMRYAAKHVSRENSPEKGESGAYQTIEGRDPVERKGKDKSADSDTDMSSSLVDTGRRCAEVNGAVLKENHLFETETGEKKTRSNIVGDPAEEHMLYDFNEDQEDGDFVLANGEEKDDETTLSEEEELENVDPTSPTDEILLLQKESEISLKELLSRYKKEVNSEVSEEESENASALSDDLSDYSESQVVDQTQQDVSMDENVESGKGSPVYNHLTNEEGLGNEKIAEENHRSAEEGSGSENMIADAAAAARSAQPTGNTFSTTKVRTKFPFLVKYPLREYQHIGLDWLVTMYEKRLNGILADEMGLGKTIMTIALLAHLACDKGIWGPHLIVVPTSVMLNWETEFLKWCPAFKILTYFGSAKERKLKRQGWMKPNSFHICITTYRLVIQDSKAFKRKKWKYLILDEAHLIKNWKSQRWQTLLNFNSKRRILLTGTPLQNDLMELWSLMHFLMPHVFQSHQEFKDWFSNPISGMVEGQERVNKEVVDRLHNVLRPFILRRLKRDVEKQLPMKHEHVIYCRLSKRQRNLYEDFIASSETQATLASANFFGMISIIMQLRKVCNHPDLFEGRPIISSFDMVGMDIQLSSSVCAIISPVPFSSVDLCSLGLLFTHLDLNMTSWECDEVNAIATPSKLIEERANVDDIEVIGSRSKHLEKIPGTNIFEEIRKAVFEERLREVRERAASVAWWNSLRCRRKPIYSTSLRELLNIKNPLNDFYCQNVDRTSYLYSSKLADVILSPVERFHKMIDLVETFMFAIPAARAPVPTCWCSKSGSSVFLPPTYKEKCSEMLLPLLLPIRPAIVRRQVYFPDRRLIQFDCGKLQELSVLLRKLKSGGHRALIFTQMTKMLDTLEAFINMYGYTYMRLDGSTPPEERQTLMQRFNTNPKIFLFILSTRSGGVGINLFGADTVIFYDSDWNPAMDQQAQDRCHRIGQTREVHIYRLISESTIEENILKKANQKRALDDLVIQSGDYNTEFFKKLDPMELFSGHKALPSKNTQKEKIHSHGNEVSLSNADVEAALKYAEDEADYMALKKVEQEEAVDNQEFAEVIGKLEDDEVVNDDDMRADEPTDLEMTIQSKDSGVNSNLKGPTEEQTLTYAANDDDVDMLADVKQMAAAAAASGQAISTFENQLRPIDRYAIRFLELWDPIIDKAAMESEVRFEEAEWELDRIEKYKEEMEAEIDDDEEPLIYERWDADFATEAYRQQVEALAQHQLMEELEAEAKEKENADDGYGDSVMNDKPSNSKPKSKKKPKKAKFKSLKKESLTSELKHVKDEPSVETMSIDDDDVSYHEEVFLVPKKRKGVEILDVESGKSSKKKSNKSKKVSETCPSDLDSNLFGNQQEDFMELKPCDIMVAADFEQKPVGRSKIGGRISITAMPVKRVLMIRPEKLKKGNVWSRDCVPSPDSWFPQEDAVLCAVVHEYGPHWNLVSETLYGMSAGGFYRGRYRHPVHCCERFRELIQRYVLSGPENPVNEKVSNAGSGKALLKVTEDNIQKLLNMTTEQPDHEFLLQKHFTALLSSVWRMTSRVNRQKTLSSSRNGLYFGRKLSSSFNQISWNSMKEPVKGMNFTNLSQSSKLASALRDANCRPMDDTISFPNRMEVVPSTSEKLEITLEFEKEDSAVPLPPFINLSIPVSDSTRFISKDEVGENHLKASMVMAESRFRDAARGCDEGSLAWASSAFSANDAKLRAGSKLQSLGKHRLPVSDPVKPARSKSKKTCGNSDMHHLSAELVLLSSHVASPSDPNLKFDLTPPVYQDGWMNDTDAYSICCLDNELSLEMGSSEAVPHIYVPDLIAGLDDWSQLPEFTDIG